jgi:hypothetical protein
MRGTLGRLTNEGDRTAPAFFADKIAESALPAPAREPLRS